MRPKQLKLNKAIGKNRKKSANDHVKELPEDWSVAARKPLWCIKDECANDEVSDENKRI